MRLAVVVAACAAAGLAAVTVADNVAGPPGWGYDGATGPDTWGSLSPHYRLCASGAQQSPIDLSASVPASIAPPALDWSAASPQAVVNTGRTIEVRLNGAGGLYLGDTAYALEAMHFHHRSEHTVDGVFQPMEVQFVHRSDTGRAAVVAVLIAEGERHAEIAKLWEVAPPQAGEAEPPRTLDLAAFLPEAGASYYYAGSLTKPPCTENVTWAVMAEPIFASRSQIEAFAALFGENRRPIQPRNRRFVLTGL